MKRISAFTIMELVVVMIITSFIFIAGYFAYFSTASRLNRFGSISAWNSEVSQLNFLICKDFAECATVSLPYPTMLKLDKSSGDEITYQFNDSVTIRNTNLMTDTFQLRASRIIGIPLEINNTFISQVTIEVVSGEKSITLNFCKKYDPFFYLNQHNP